MTANRLSGTLKFIVTLDDQLRLQTAIERVRDVLNQLVQSPADTAQQSNLASARDDLDKATERLATAITPSHAAAIAEMGGAEFFDSAIAAKVRESIAENAMTPSVARDFVKDLAQRRAAFLQTVRTTVQGLDNLNVKPTPLSPGGADVSFIIPRDLFQNNLEGFTKELGFINRLVQDVSEGVTGTREPPELESLSSSIPTITLDSAPAVISVLSLIVQKFLDAWERIKRIRQMRDEMTEMGIEGPPVECLSEQVTTTVEQIVEESTDLVLHAYEHETPRKYELRNAVRTDVRRLYGQIERGLTIDFRAEAQKDADEETAKALTTIINLSRQMQFPPPTNEPLLLVGAEVLEGELHKKTYKKTITTKTTTTTKKASKKKDPPDGAE